MSETTVTCAAGEICQEGACVSETCTTGDTRCGDGALLTCEAGSNWASAACGAGEICTEDADGARCEDRVCQPLLASCDAGAAVVCDVDGRSETRTTCADDEICDMGYCVTATCDEIAAGHAGTIAAGCAEVCEAIFAPDSTDNVRECVGDLADAQSCEPPDGHEEGCDITDRACSEDIFLTEESCILAGYTWGSVPYENEDGCEGAEGTWTAPWPTYDDSHDVASCKQWMKACDVSTSACEELNTAWCECSDCLADQDALAPTADAAGGATEDAGPEEVAPHPGLEPISHISFKLSGIPNEFTLAAMADYQESDKRFVISASDGARKLEINLAPVEGYTVGAWSDSDDSDSSVAVCYHDGSQNETPPEGAGCSVGFSHAAILYILSIDQNNGDGSRVTGNFVATLVDSSNAELEFTEGTFDVLHQ